MVIVTIIMLKSRLWIKRADSSVNIVLPCHCQLSSQMMSSSSLTALSSLSLQLSSTYAALPSQLPSQFLHFYIMRFDTNSIYCHIVVSACHFCHACHTSQKATPSCLSRSAFKATRLDAEAVNIVRQTIDMGESVG